MSAVPPRRVEDPRRFGRVGLVIGGIITAIVRQLTRHPEEFVVE